MNEDESMGRALSNKINLRFRQRDTLKLGIPFGTGQSDVKRNSKLGSSQNEAIRRKKNLCSARLFGNLLNTMLLVLN